MRVWAWLLSAALFHFVHISCTADEGGGDGSASVLPQTSADFFAAYSCNDDGSEWALLNDDENGSFYRWVLAGRHITWHPGWEVPPGSRADDGVAGDGKQYARVFDLLNWARQQRLMPVPVDVASICHKGMEARYMNGVRWADANHLPTKPNPHISNETWNNLWNDCNKQLLSTTRLASSACIDVPGALVANPNPPWEANNPCHLEYRMVDGAHRLCLRKYALVLLHGELAELEECAKQLNDEVSMEEIKHQIEQTRRLIHQTSQGQYIVFDQATFVSMLMRDEPHETWARSKEHLLKELPHDERRDWKEWMKLVLASVRSEL